jgi:hypothetical protein
MRRAFTHPRIGNVLDRAYLSEWGRHDRSMMKRPWSAGLALVLLLCSNRALAQEQPRPVALNHAASEQVFLYVEPARPNLLRAVIEEAALFGLGSLQYFTNQEENSKDWDHSYSLHTLSRKLSGNDFSLDTNRFDTNFIGHLGSGTLYYIAARGNRLPWWGSYAMATAFSTLWEIVGELRENVSVNDLIVTPTSGFVFGESGFQLGAFFDRSCATPVNSVLGTVFAPTKAIHDAIDGKTLLRDTDCDRFGLTQRGGHELRLSLGGALLFPDDDLYGSPVVESVVAAHTRVVALDEYGAPGRGRTSFADVNASELWFDTGLTATHYTDFGFKAGIQPIGLHWRSIAAGPGGVFGNELLLGLLVGAEYNVHRFDAAQSGKDRVFLLNVPGAAALYRRHEGRVRYELELQASPTLAGIEAFALDAYLSRSSGDGLTSVAELEGYNYAGGFTVFPRLRLYAPWLELGVEAATTRVWAITTFDRFNDSEDHVAVSEGRTAGNTWVTFGPHTWPLRLSLRGAGLHRFGSIGSVRASRTEWRLGATLDAVM